MIPRFVDFVSSYQESDAEAAAGDRAPVPISTGAQYVGIVVGSMLVANFLSSHSQARMVALAIRIRQMIITNVVRFLATLSFSFLFLI